MTAPAQDMEAARPVTSPIAGWYGKLPFLGDFASRRLPREFVESWDAWLQRSIAASRRALDERWLDLFLTSPMWRFALAPGVCGKYAWAGLMLPSVDKVGRYFPLTLALPIERCDADLAQVFSAHDWYAGLESIGLTALNVDFSIEQLEAALAEHPFPVTHPTPAPASAAQGVADWLDTQAGGACGFDFASGDSISTVMDGAARTQHAARVAGKSFWWCVGEESGTTEMHCSAGLPPEEYYVVLLGGSREGAAVPADPLLAFGFEQTENAEPAR